MKSFKFVFVLCMIMAVLCLSENAFAQIPDEITGLKLKDESLTMTAGETYRFEPEITSKVVSGAVNIRLHLFSSDENVVHVTEELNTIEAVGGGTAEVRVFTSGYEFSAVCRVSVSGEAKSVVQKGELWEGPAAAQLVKVSIPSMKNFYEMLAKPAMADTASMIARQTKFSALVRVTAGEAEKLADLMRELGMSPVYVFERINTVSAKGTAEQFAELLKNENVVRIDRDEIYYSQAVPDSGPLQGQAETISHFSVAHDMGLDGSGTAVAIIDSGVFPEHEQFTEKEEGTIIHGACFNADPGVDEEDGMIMTPTCVNGTGTDLESGWIGPDFKASDYTHGTHVTGIAAGKDGVAPKADIITLNVFTKIEYECTIFGMPDICVSAGSRVSDQIRAFTYLEEIVESEGINLAAINMSLGGSKYKDYCREEDREPYIKAWLDRGTITAIASGNEYLDGMVTAPACLPSAFTVGALTNNGTPQIADYSNHSKLVDILAPGSQILSSVPKADDDGYIRTNEYEIMDGTSMATPMVTGSAALLRQQFPDASASFIEGLLTGMTDQSAARAKITKPVLDFANLPAAAELLDNGPDVKVYGGNGFLLLEFGQLPFSVNYTVTLNTVPASAKPVKTVKGTDLTTLKFQKLTNNKVYAVTVDYSFTGLEESQSLSLKGMPMKPGTGYTIALDEDSEDTPAVKFGWNPEADAELVVEYSQGDTAGTVVTADAETSWDETEPNQLVTANFYKRVTDGDDIYMSVPSALQILPLGMAEPRFWDVYQGKVYLCFDEPAEGLTGREVRITKLETGFDDNWNIIITDRTPFKTYAFTCKKAPTDLLITGIKGEFAMEIEVRNYVTVGKTTYYGPWFKLWWENYGGNQQEYFYNYVEKWDKDKEVNTMKRSEMTDVTVNAGNGSVTLTWQRNLIADGYQIRIKPVEPNRAQITETAAAKLAREGYTVKNLTNGVVYKMRIRWFSGTAKKPIYSSYYPNDTGSNSEQNSTWEGIYFIPMPVPDVTKINDNGTIVLNSDGSLDKLVIVKVSGEDPAASSVLYADVVKGKNLIDLELAENERSIMLMYAKVYNDFVYYGPAAYLSPVPEGENEMNIGYGAKSAEEIDLMSILALAARAAQINGEPIPEEERYIPKAVEEVIEEVPEEDPVTDEAGMTGKPDKQDSVNTYPMHLLDGSWD